MSMKVPIFVKIKLNALKSFTGSHTTKRKNLRTLIQRDTCTPVFIAALFTIAKTWKQLKCPLRDECIKKRWYIYTMEYYPAIKKEYKNTNSKGYMHPCVYSSRIYNSQDMEAAQVSPD